MAGSSDGRRNRPAVGAALLLMLCIAIWAAGSIVVIDRGGMIASATVTNGGTSQTLHRLPDGVFYAVLRFDGYVLLRCARRPSAVVGPTDAGAYVSRHRHTWLRIVPNGACGSATVLRQDYNL